MINAERVVVVAILVVTSSGWLGRVTAQGSGTDVLPALLAEVRGLRAAMEQMASAGPRIQLFTSRLQLQETRINNLVRRLDTVRDSLEGAQRKAAEIGLREKDLASAVEEHRASSAASSREEAEQASYMLQMVKREEAGVLAQVTRLTGEEAQLTQDLAAEQARWTEISRRLDELDQALVKK